MYGDGVGACIAQYELLIFLNLGMVPESHQMLLLPCLVKVVPGIVSNVEASVLEAQMRRTVFLMVVGNVKVRVSLVNRVLG